jgi:hypothetical protein
MDDDRVGRVRRDGERDYVMQIKWLVGGHRLTADGTERADRRRPQKPTHLAFGGTQYGLR